MDALYLFIYVPIMQITEKPLAWIGSSYRDLMALPADVRRHFGFALSLAQAGEQYDAAKILKDLVRERLRVAEAYVQKGLRS